MARRRDLTPADYQALRGLLAVHGLDPEYWSVYDVTEMWHARRWSLAQMVEAAAQHARAPQPQAAEGGRR